MMHECAIQAGFTYEASSQVRVIPLSPVSGILKLVKKLLWPLKVLR